MSTTRTVRTIPASRDRFTAAPASAPPRRRVAGYARVSTDHDDQFTSYEAQVDYYTTYIKGRPDWEFVRVYTDEGITGTSTKRREGFRSMVADALDGKIDLIVTKSVSRFARNTVDSLTTIRELKERGVEVYFEKENIWTFDGKGELLITIMSSLAQEESRSISENVTWGQRKRFSDGKVTVAFSRFLGYDRGDDGGLVVNPEQAATVRRIYREFLEGKSYHAIARGLMEDHVPAPCGGDTWYGSTVRSILTNEKYKGDALLQKSYVEDFLTKRQVPNDGVVPQYYVEGDHEAIIDPEAFDMVQREVERRGTGGRRCGSNALSGMVVCGECGGTYGRKVWHSGSKYRKVMWRCNRKYDGNEPCRTPSVSEDEIKAAFVSAANRELGRKGEVAANVRELTRELLSTDGLLAEREGLEREAESLAAAAEREVAANARLAQDQGEYRRRYGELAERYAAATDRVAEIDAELRQREARAARAREYAAALERQPGALAGFSDEAFHALVDHVTVHAADDIRVTFRDGREART